MTKSRNYGSLVTGLLIVAAVAAGGYYYWKTHQDKGPDFYTAQVTRGEVVQTVTATGTIKPFLDVLVSSQISGYVTSLGVDFNSKVKKGDLLATLLPTAYAAAVQSAQGDLDNSRANAQLQRINLKRDKGLLDKNLLPQSDYDTQAALTAEAEAQIEIKTAALETAQTNLGYCRITSPIDGMVISRSVDIGNSVAATLSSPTLFEIAADLTKMQIDAAVSEADIGHVANGQIVNFTVDAYPNRQFSGKVYQIRSAPSTQQSVVIYDVMIAVENPDLKLRPGMTANVGIVISRRSDVLKLPNSALRFRMPESLMGAPPAPAAHGGNNRSNPDAPVSRNIYTLADELPGTKPAPVRVTLGITDGTDTEVLKGVKENDTVITGLNEVIPSQGGARNPFSGQRR